MSRAAALPAFLLVAVAGLLGAGYLLLDYSPAVLAFPAGIGGVLCALCALEIARALGSRAAPPAAALEPLSPAALAWMFALAAFILALGFVLGPAAYLLACLRANGGSWRLAAGVAAASVALTWGLFIEVFGILLPVAPPWLP
jgi:hypothetical protein